MAANSALQITNVDFESIKDSLRTFLKQQDTLKDYNFEASGLSVLIDLLAYNTQYNAYYLNMVANEMFLDSAVQRSSAVSHAKLLGYTPKSFSAPKATVNVAVYQVISDSSLTMPKFTKFISEPIDDVNYTFSTAEAYTVPVNSATAFFEKITLIQGSPASYSFVVDTSINKLAKVEIPDDRIDTSTLVVTVQESSSNSNYETYTLAADFIALDSTSLVYFLQEGMNGKYEIYFGDGILGKALATGNIINISYVITQGTSSHGASNFSIMAPISGYSNVSVSSVSASAQGSEREALDSIKFSAPKAYAAQGRAVTKEDYMYLIQRNSTNLPIESVSVWGGEENDPPVYGQIFCSIKPTGGYSLTVAQKEQLIEDVIKPISVLTVTPTLVDPDYTYIKLLCNVLYNPKKTSYTSGQIQSLVRAAILSFADSSLNTFNSSFNLPDLITAIQNADKSIVTNECIVEIQKKFYPSLTTPTTYSINYGIGLKRNYFNAGIHSSPALKMYDENSFNAIREGVFLEEVPSTSGGILEINVTNQGFGYTTPPTIAITGDGEGAEAQATLASGRIKSITVTNPGFNYTQAHVTITPASSDTTGGFATALPVIDGQLGTLRSYYYNNGVKTILDDAIGTVDYIKGTITLTNFWPNSVDNELGQLSVTATPETTLITSAYNRIITVDEFDPEAITVKVTATS